MSNLPTLTSLIQPRVDSRWLWAARVPTLTLTLFLLGVVIWSFVGSDAGLEGALPFIPYLIAFGWALWAMCVNPPAKFGVALAAGLGLIASLLLLLASISSTYSFLAAWGRYRVAEPLWGLLAGVEACMTVSAAVAYRHLSRGETRGRRVWAVRILSMAAALLAVLAFSGYFQQARRFDAWLAPLDRVLVLLGALLIALTVLWFFRSQAVTQGTEARRALILILSSGPVGFGFFFLWFVSSIYYERSTYQQASPMMGLIWWLPALLAFGYTVSAAKVFFLLKREGGDVWRLVGASSLAVAVVVTSAAYLPRGHRRYAPQASAVGSLRTINTAQITYASTYNGSYSSTLAQLGLPPRGASPTASAAGLIDEVLATGTKNGYRFIYTPGARDSKGAVVSYTLTASPLNYTHQTRLNFFTDQTGVIRSTHEDRSATAQDPPLPD